MKNQIVAIVGRPNVGKSTLFNRIIRKREAIIDNQPGVTRDRNYAITEWAGVPFTLIDTGGYIPDTVDKIERETLMQAQGAIEEADVIIFVVDALTGITGIDFEIGRSLVRSDKPVLLVVNKVDNARGEMDVPEFYQLGLGTPLSIGALSGRGIGDFLDEIIALFPPKSTQATLESSEDVINLAVVGRPNVGKSSFINALLGFDRQIVTDIPGTTRDAIDTPFRYQKQDYLLIDTAGIRRRTKIKESVEYYSIIRSYESIARCDVAIVMIDADEGMTDQDKRVILEVINRKKGLILAVNKWDLITKDSKTAQEFEKVLKEGLRGEHFIPIMFVSVLQKQRLYRLIELATSVYHERRKRIKTGELNRFLEEIVAAFHPSDYGKYQVKLNYCSQVKAAPPIFVFHSNFPEAIKDNYRKYIENKIREQYGFSAELHHLAIFGLCADCQTQSHFQEDTNNVSQ